MHYIVFDYLFCVFQGTVRQALAIQWPRSRMWPLLWHLVSSVTFWRSKWAHSTPTWVASSSFLGTFEQPWNSEDSSRRLQQYWSSSTLSHQAAPRSDDLVHQVAVHVVKGIRSMASHYWASVAPFRCLSNTIINFAIFLHTAIECDLWIDAIGGPCAGGKRVEKFTPSAVKSWGNVP